MWMSLVKNGQGQNSGEASKTVSAGVDGKLPQGAENVGGEQRNEGAPGGVAGQRRPRLSETHAVGSGSLNSIKEHVYL